MGPFLFCVDFDWNKSHPHSPSCCDVYSASAIVDLHPITILELTMATEFQIPNRVIDYERGLDDDGVTHQIKGRFTTTEGTFCIFVSGSGSFPEGEAGRG